MRLYNFLFVIALGCLASTSFAQSTKLNFGEVLYNLTFPADNETEYMYFEVDINYDPAVPSYLQTIILSYFQYYDLNVYASFNNTFPNSTDHDYVGTSKDGNVVRGLLWIPSPQQDVTLYIGVSRYDLANFPVFGLNVEYPHNMLNYSMGLRYEADISLQPWQTQWFWVPYQTEAISGFRAELCDESAGDALTMSLVFPEANVSDPNEFNNPCGCTDYYVEDRTRNLITQFPFTASQMFLITPGVADENNSPIYFSIFLSGTYDPDDTFLSTSLPCDKKRSLKKRTQRATRKALRSLVEGFRVRLSLYPQENYPTIRTKYTKPDRVNDDLLANVDDTPYCNFWNSTNFTAYVSTTDYHSFDSACFLEYHAANFTTYDLRTIVGGEDFDERVLGIDSFFKNHDVDKEQFVFNIVHSNDDCGSYAYFHNDVPADGWSMAKSEEWPNLAIGLVSGAVFLFLVFLISTIVLALRIREYKNYNHIPM